MITRFINEIRGTIELEEIEFLGDGVGDFEKRDRDASKECIDNYLIYLQKQRELAIKSLENISNQ